MATVAEIVENAATELGIFGEGQTIRAAHSDDLTKSYNEVYAALSVKSMATWDIDEDVPDEYVPHVVALVAWGRVNRYAIPNDRYKRIGAAAREAPLAIGELNASDTFETPKAEYM